MRLALKWSVRLAAALLVLFAVVAGFLATAPGQGVALALAGYLASDADTRVAIGRLDGSLFGDGRIDRIVVSDRKGPWLTVRDVHLSWRPLQLFAGRVAVDSLVVASVRVLRAPESSATAADSDDDAGMPSLLPLTARRVEVSELVLEKPLAGMPARLRLTAAADLADLSRPLTAELSIARLDAEAARLDASFAYRPDTDVLDIRIAGAEPAGGLIAHLLEFPKRPPLAVTFEGSGPRDRWRADWALSASGEPFAAGTAALDKVEAGRRFAAQLEGYLANVAPAALTDVLSGKTVAKVAGVWSGRERFAIDELSLASDAAALQATGRLDLARMALSGRAALRLAHQDGTPVLIPAAGAQTILIDSLTADLSLPQTEQRTLRASVRAKGISGAFGALAAVQLEASAEQDHAVGATAFDARAIRAALRADALRPSASDPDAPPLSAKLSITGTAKNGLLTIAALRGETGGATLTASGTIEDARFRGSAELSVPDLARFSALAAQPLSGGVALRAAGLAALDAADLDLTVEAAARDAGLGIAAVDGLLAGTARLNGRLARSSAGELQVKNLTLATPALSAALNARAGTQRLALDARVALKDLSKVDPSLAGAATLVLAVSGPRSDLVSKAALTGENVRVHGARLTAPELSFAGRGPLAAHAGRLEIKGDVDGKPLAGSAAIAYAEQSGLAIDGLQLAVASAKAAGSIRVPPTGAPHGRIEISIPRAADLSALAGVALAGSATAAVELAGDAAAPVLTVRAEASALRVAGNKLQSLALTARLDDYARALNIDGKLRLAAIDADGLALRDLRLDAKPAADGTSIAAKAAINGFEASLRAQATREDSAFAVALDAASLRGNGLSAVVDQRATLTYRDGTAKIDRLVIKTDKGRTEIAGTIAPDAIKASIDLKRLPAALANAFDSTLGLEGHIDGNVSLAGTTASPTAEAALAWTGASAALLRAHSLPALRLDARARLKGEQVAVDVTAGGVQGLSVKASGNAGLAAKASLKLHVAGTIPLNLANGALGERAASASGSAVVAADVTGTLAAPQVAGTLRIDGATLNDPASGLKLVNVTGNASFTQAGVTIERLAGASSRGGTFASRGGVALLPGGPPVTNLSLDVVGLKFDDQQLMSGELDANLAVRGRLDALLARGTIGLKRLDVTVPSELPGSITALDIKHVNAPAGSYAARESAKVAEGQGAPPVSGRLDVQLNAASRIFVRGRGLDAQLGGGLHIRGTTESPRADGAFVVERGRLTIVGRQLDFKRGRIFFNGTLQPMLDMEAAADADGYTISVFITGPASKPAFRFSSDPQLPEDEVIARLLFNKSLAKLSPVQLAQLAGEIDKIGGLSSGPSTLDRLKSAAGIDVFDVSTDDANNPTVSAGSYVDESTYVGVKQGTTASSSRVVIDHDLTKTLKAKGELGADGNSKIGIGVEWDY